MNPQYDEDLKRIRYRRALRGAQREYGAGSQEVRDLKRRFQRAARRLEGLRKGPTGNR